MNYAHFNQLSPAELERLAIAAEEMGEAIQIIGKIVRHGYESTHPDGGDTNRLLLEKELGDVLYAIGAMWSYNDIRMMAVHKRSDDKRDSIRKYLHHFSG